MLDIFKREVEIGDYVAAGMNLNRSSVLRIGQVVKINKQNTTNWNGEPTNRESVRVRWRNNGNTDGGYWKGVEESNILYDPTYRYAKVVILDPEFVERFPEDIEHDE